MATGIPQGYTIDSLRRRGHHVRGRLGAARGLRRSASPGSARASPTSIARVPAPRDLRLHDRGHVAAARCAPAPRGSPLMLYNLNRRDTARILKATAMLCDVSSPPARSACYPMVAGDGGALDPRRRERSSARWTLAPSDFDLTAYHPLGTCRIGTDPKRSVLGPDSRDARSGAPLRRRRQRRPDAPWA